MGKSLTGLSSDEPSRAKLVLKGVYGVSSPLDIVGAINPLAQKKFADVAISFKDIELSNFTPYSARYIGYKIKKEKLVLDLEYTIDGNTLKNLIVKVVTSPFSVIGAMFGGGEELGYVDFEYGESAIAEADHEKLDKLAEILKEKPAVKFEIQGVYDGLRDAESLRVKQFEEAVRTATGQSSRVKFSLQ